MEFPVGRKLAVNGIDLIVHEAGSGIPVVLAHGWPELAYSWRYQVEPLVAAGYRVIMPDQRGYGDSSKPEPIEAYDIHHLCADHVALLDVLDIERAVYVGHDWGAIMVWQHALLHPDRVAGVANLSVPFAPRTVDPVARMEEKFGPDHYIVHFNRQPGVAVNAFNSNVEGFLRNMYTADIWRDTAGDMGASGRNIIAIAEQRNVQGELIMSEAEFAVFVDAFTKSGFRGPCNWYCNFTRNWETTEGLDQQVTQPAMMIYGQYDLVPPNPFMGEFVSDLEEHTLQCGHWIQQECPAETNQLLVDWLDRRMRPLF